MASSTIIIDYLGEGTLAARPAAPALPTGGIGLYYATDNGNTYLYDTGGTAWILLASSGSAVTARSMTATGNTTGGTSSTTGPQSAMTYSGAGAVSVGFTNGTLIVSSPATVASATSMGRTYTGNTGGDSSSSTQAITGQTLSGAGIVTVGVSGGTQFISASSAASATNLNMSALGNTNQATSSFAETLTKLSVSATGALSAGFDTNGVLILSVPAAGASGTANSEVALGNTTGATSSTVQTLGSLSVSGAGNVSVGFSTTAAGAGVMIISGAAGGASGTVQTQMVIGNTTGVTSSGTLTLANWTISGAGDVDVGLTTTGTGANVLLISGASGTANSEYALGNTTGATSSTVQTLQSLSVSGAGGVSIGFSTTAANQGVMIVSGATTVASGTAENMVALGNTFGATSSSVLTLTAMTVSATGGISAGFSTTAVGAGVLELSVAPPIASATAQNITLLGNTNQATSSFADTITGRSISATGGVSAGFDTNGVLILSGAAGGAGSTSESVFALGNTTGATSSATQALSGISFSGAGGVSVGFTTTGAGANVLQISGAAGGGGGSISFSQIPVQVGALSANIQMQLSRMVLQPFNLQSSLVMNQVRLPVGMTGNLALTDASSAASRSLSATASGALVAVAYSSTAYQQWSSITSGSAGFSLTATISESGSSWSEAVTYQYQLGSTTTSTTASTTTNTANASVLSSLGTQFFGTGGTTQLLEQVIPFATTLVPSANLIMGLYHSTVGGSTGAGAGTTRFNTPTPLWFYVMPSGSVNNGNNNYYQMGLLTALAAVASTIPIGYSGIVSTSKSASFSASDILQFQFGGILMSLGNFTA